MASLNLTAALRTEYQDLFDTCMIRPEKSAVVDQIATKIVQKQTRYAAVGDPLGIPWYFVGIIHNMEASLNFNTHLHNGDPLTKRTTNVPAGRPTTGSPPFTWEFSASDALNRLKTWTDWAIPGILYMMEAYNGFGYRIHHPAVLSPYLWSFTTHYVKGKYVSDGTWSPAAVSQQCGAAALLRRMSESGVITFDAGGVPDPGNTGSGVVTTLPPLLQFSKTKKSVLAEEIQKALNKAPGVFIGVDGVPGKQTSDAVKKVFGHYLAGDPRA
jgi:lysozyme family protein